jgi:hypothetical protein
MLHASSWLLNEAKSFLRVFSVIVCPSITVLVALAHGGKDSAITTNQFQRPSSHGWGLELLHSSVMQDSVYQCLVPYILALLMDSTEACNLLRGKGALHAMLDAHARARAVSDGDKDVFLFDFKATHTRLLLGPVRRATLFLN